MFKYIFIFWKLLSTRALLKILEKLQYIVADCYGFTVCCMYSNIQVMYSPEMLCTVQKQEAGQVEP